jgi:hypothetical protein
VPRARAGNREVSGPSRRALRSRAAQRGAEGDEPQEDQPEADDLEHREADQTGDEHGDRRYEDHGDATGDPPQASRRPGAREHDHEDPEEREHRPGRAALVQRGVDVEGDEAHDRQVHSERCDERDEQSGDVRVRVHGSLQLLQDVGKLAAHAGGEHEQQAAGRHRPGVEGHAGEIGVRAQLTEVQAPPFVVRCRRSRDGGTDDEHHDRDDREVPRVRPEAARTVGRVGFDRALKWTRQVDLDRRRHRHPHSLECSGCRRSWPAGRSPRTPRAILFPLEDGNPSPLP